MVIDGHCHLAGVEEGRTGCFIRPRLRARPPVAWLARRHRLGWRPAAGTDDRLAAELAALVAASRRVDRAVALAFDAVYDTSGRLREGETLFYVPNDHCLAVCRRHPELLPGVSIHPYRKDALAELERCRLAGAVAVKWLPSVQGMDPADRRCLPFYERLAELGLPLLCHTGREHIFPPRHRPLESPARLRLPLEVGVTVVAAHAGSLGALVGEEGFGERVALSLAFPNLYADLSGMAIPGRGRHLALLARCRHLHDRLVNGSDYPVPPFALPFLGELGRRRVREIAAIANPFDRDVALKEALGFPPDLFHRAATLFRPAAGR
ncbi:MAG: metal-dependent hydrolase [Nitrospirae bacterium]|nr:MAG: metal-dependent hydrolase [Nitrospirota bacterium]